MFGRLRLFFTQSQSLAPPHFFRLFSLSLRTHPSPSFRFDGYPRSTRLRSASSLTGTGKLSHARLTV